MVKAIHSHERNNKMNIQASFLISLEEESDDRLLVVSKAPVLWNLFSCQLLFILSMSYINPIIFLLNTFRFTLYYEVNLGLFDNTYLAFRKPDWNETLQIFKNVDIKLLFSFIFQLVLSYAKIWQLTLRVLVHPQTDYTNVWFAISAKSLLTMESTKPGFWSATTHIVPCVSAALPVVGLIYAVQTVAISHIFQETGSAGCRSTST